MKSTNIFNIIFVIFVVFPGHEEHPRQQSRKSGGLEPSGRISVLHRHVPVRMDGQHGAHNEGAGVARHLHHGLHGGQETPRDQSRPSDHRELEAEGRGGQERQGRERSGHSPLRDRPVELRFHAGRAASSRVQNLQDDQARSGNRRGGEHAD